MKQIFQTLTIYKIKTRYTNKRRPTKKEKDIGIKKAEKKEKVWQNSKRKRKYSEKNKKRHII